MEITSYKMTQDENFAITFAKIILAKSYYFGFFYISINSMIKKWG